MIFQGDQRRNETVYLSPDFLADRGSHLRAKLELIERKLENPGLPDQERRWKIQVQRPKIEAAFARLKAGTYGICLACDEPVPMERLIVRPEATRCIACERDAETRHAARAA